MATIVLSVCTNVQAGFDFSNINRWIGAGPDRAALMIDWNDGKSQYSEVWGYYFTDTGSLTAWAMLLDIATQDTQVYLKYDSEAGFGPALFGIGYDADDDGFSLVPGANNVFNSNGLLDENTDPLGGPYTTQSGNADGNVTLDPDDRYEEGWNTGFYAFYHENDNPPYNGLAPFNGGAWEQASTGLSGHIVTDDGWVGLSWAPGFSATVPAVPEPTSLVLLGLGSLALLRRCR